MTAFFFTEFKLRHMEMWTSYEETLTFTTLPGSDLVQFYAIKSDYIRRVVIKISLTSRVNLTIPNENINY